MQSVVVVAIHSGQQMLGILQLGSRTPRSLNPGQISLLETFGNQLGVAVQKFRFHEEVQKNLERIRALHEVDRAITSTLDLQTILDVLLEKISLLFPIPSATTVRLLNQNGQLEPTACRNLGRDEWQAALGETPGVLSGMVLASRAPVIIRNLWMDPRTRHMELLRRHHLVSYLGIPLIAKDRVLGRLGFYTKNEHEFRADEIEFLATLADQAAIAIHNSRSYEEMVRANRLKEDFLGVMSHELRTPLNVVMGYAAMMKDRMLGDINPEQERALAKITERSNNLLGMINSILHVTSLEARTTLVESYEVDLPDLLNELKEDYQSAAPETVELFWNDFPDLPVIRTDGRKLKHILQNVIGNALKFTEQGSVTVSTRHVAAENKVEFEVADTGIGIPKEMMPVIFDKFLQADGSQTRRYEGLGLGLYIVKQFAELLGGTVEVKSHAGKGSTFTVRLPYASCR